MKIFCIILAAIMLIVLGGGCGVSGEYKNRLGEEIVYLQQKQRNLVEFDEKIVLGADLDKKNERKSIKKWIKNNKKSPNMDKALFLQGQAFFDRKLYYQAFESFEKLLDEHAASELFEAALYKETEIACLFLMGKKRKVFGFIPSSARTEGVTILEQAAQRWPGSELAAKALMIKADYHNDKRRLLEALYDYQAVIDECKNSRRSSQGIAALYEQAMLRCAEVTHNLFLGPEYDGTCLADALIRYQQYQLNFPKKARQANVNSQMKLISDQQAQKELEIANYYQRTHKNASAKLYWKMIRQQWSGTEWAQEAQDNIEEGIQNSEFRIQKEEEREREARIQNSEDKR
ncbi:MAG: hypothetical protein KAT56_05925 [Sedimentisphaerales bacterium]|nr:hypothetical protein [Sedimentisphaerales bacterium]